MSGSVSPLPWTGSKGCIYTTIDAFMPPHKTYVEPCMGSAEVFLRKKPSEREIINDYKEYYRQMMFSVNYGKSVKSRVKKTKPTRYSGYASRYAITEFEIGESDTISHWITEAEYAKLTEEGKQDYTYYEWDEYGDWYAMFVWLSRMIDTMLDIFKDWSLCNIHDANLDERTPSADYVRLIVYID